jgi:hypothetical protein
MTELSVLTAQAFAPSGALARAATNSQQNYQPREGQQQMATAIANAIALRSSVVARVWARLLRILCQRC